MHMGVSSPVRALQQMELVVVSLRKRDFGVQPLLSRMHACVEVCLS